MILAPPAAWHPRADCVSCPYGNGIAILDLNSNVYFSLNDVGALIWGRIAGGATQSDLVDAVAREYDITPETCADDVAALIRDMSANSLIEWR